MPDRLRENMALLTAIMAVPISKGSWMMAFAFLRLSSSK